MNTITKNSNFKAWSQAVISPAIEFNLTPLKIISGKIPEQLRGSLYRNGPARLERGNQRYGHWFDGDGAILAVHFTAEGATAIYRYVQTEGYQKEALANKILFPNYGTVVPGKFWQSWGKPVKNAANTSVLALENKLLALWEGGKPHALNLETLETLGIDNLDSLLGQETFSAHPKIDPKTGDIYNFGFINSLKSQLILYQYNVQGKLLNRSATKIKGLPIIHDFVLAGQYIIFFVSPVRVNLLATALGWQSFSDGMQWKPELGTEILIFERENLSLVSRNFAEPWYQWHYTNGYVEKDGSIIVEIVRFPDFQTNQNLKEVATGKITTPAKATLWQIRLDPQTAKVIESYQLCDRGCEFPVINPAQVGEFWRYTYLSVHRDNIDITPELFGAIARFDHQNQRLNVADMGANCYPTEPIFVAKSHNSDSGWLLTVVYDGNTDSSEVRIYDSDRLEDNPICRLELPSVIPPGFHGTWKNDK